MLPMPLLRRGVIEANRRYEVQSTTTQSYKVKTGRRVTRPRQGWLILTKEVWRLYDLPVFTTTSTLSLIYYYTDEFTQVSDSGIRMQPTHLQRER